ncbi:MAG: DUF3341 domain-containing protein [Rhodothermales bacterium]|nr:DUF3341 domain-containing protein [Rhodothermales bacterium]
MIKEITTQVKSTMSIFEARKDRLYGVLAEFSDPGDLYHAAEKVRDEGYRHFDVHSPFPIHGMDKAMGLGNSKVGYITLIGGLTGLATGILLQWWTGAVDYPLNISGKPFFAFEPSIPVIFELTILFAALGAVAGMFALNGLPRPYNPLFYSEKFHSVTDDGFFLHIAASDKKFEIIRTVEFLEGIGASYIEKIVDKSSED